MFFSRLGERKVCYASQVQLLSRADISDGGGRPLSNRGRRQITVLNQWNMGESDAGAALGGTGANPTIDSIGGWNLNEVGSPTYVAGAYSGSPLALSFANPVGGTPSQYYYNFNNTSNTYISPTSNTNWGYDFWFNCSSLPTAGGNWQPSEETMVCFGGNGGWFQANAAVEVELYNQGNTTTDGTPIGMLYVSDWSGSAGPAAPPARRPPALGITLSTPMRTGPATYG